MTTIKILKALTIISIILGFGTTASHASSFADYNGNCVVDAQDVNAFVTDFYAHTAASDFNNDNMWDMRDVLGFVNSYQLLTQSPELVCAGNNDIEFVVLQPGQGFAESLQVPPSVGDISLAGYDAQAIARWDVVPYQRFGHELTHDLDSDEDLFEIGVVAFHMNGIDRVEFSLNGGPWAAVSEMQQNPRTGVFEYTAALDASLMDDGLVEVRAIVYPKIAGQPRVLAGTMTDDGMRTGEYSLFLYSNDDETLSTNDVKYVAKSGDDSNDGSRHQPYKTMKKAIQSVEDGGKIVLVEAGRYPIEPRSDRNFQYWTVVEAAEHLHPESVTIGPDEWARMPTHTNRLKFQNIGFDHAYLREMDPGAPASMWAIPMVWFDNARWFNSLGWEHAPAGYRQPVKGWNQKSYAYSTNSVYRDMVYGPVSHVFVRGADIEQISGDVFQNSLLVLNSKVDGAGGSILSHHSDLFQYMTPGYPNPNPNPTNVIAYNVEAMHLKEVQTFFWRLAPTTPLENFAFVNVFSHMETGAPPHSQNYNPNNHILYSNITLLGQAFMFRVGDALEGQGYEPHNVVIRDSILQQVSATPFGTAFPPGMRFENNHFFYGQPQGLDATNGGAMEDLFADMIGYDFSPSASSVFVDRVSDPFSPADLNGLLRDTPASIGALNAEE